MSQIKVEPPEIIFESVLPGNLYAMTISVRNLSHSAQRIRLSAPKSGLFALNYVPSGVIAPGLDLRAEIECQIPAELMDHNFTDKIVATMGNEQVIIPLRASKPYANIIFERNLSLGNALMNQQVMKELYFDNRSHLNGSLKFSLSKGSLLKLSTYKLDLLPYGSNESRQCVKVIYEGKELGAVREFIRVAVLGSTEEIIVDVTGQVIEQTLSLVNSNKQGILENANFGSLFFGEQKTIESYLINSGPTALSFSLKYDDEDESNLLTSADASNNQVDPYVKCMTISPAEGIVKPYSQVHLSMSFVPLFNPVEKGFMNQTRKEMYETKQIIRNVKIECVDSNQNLTFVMNGNATLPQIQLTPTLLRFGECAVNDRRDILLSMKNPTSLPISFEFPIAANFKFDPMKGKIMKNETMSIVASFVPTQLGVFKTTVTAKIQNGLEKIDLKLVGESNATTKVKHTMIGGTDKLPYDFDTQLRFVNPEEESNVRLEKKKGKEKETLTLERSLRQVIADQKKFGYSDGMRINTQDMQAPDFNTVLAAPVPDIIEASRERDEIYGTDENPSKKKNPRETLQDQMSQFYKEHNAFYNGYIQQSHTNRELFRMAKVRNKLVAKGGVDYTDPNSVNMGMERGLDEPALHAPMANEPLWTQSTANAGGLGGESGGAGGAGGNARGRLPVDENRLIQKKYNSVPVTQAELRDCATELTVDELKMVTASHKMIDFGKICVGSLSAKNFVVFNGLKHSVLIRVEDLDLEMSQSKALCQIIPDSCMAGFDMYFTSRVLGKVKKSFTWKINDLHAFKVHVTAEVVPIECTMSKTSLVMEFAPDSLKPTLTSEIILSNPGNAYADYLWGSVGAFSCEPERGSIAPGKSAVISITWDPHGGKRTEEEIGLHITGGIDQVLTVKGILPETKAEFSDKRLSLGIMAVGTEKELRTNIINTGHHPLCFFLHPVDESLGMSIEPMEACVGVGESCELKVCITPKTARSYDNVSIGAKVRGGKSIHVRLNGSSIIPTIELSEETFKYGQVTIGSNIRLPFTLKNKSPILANLILDLSSFPDFYPNLLNPLEVVDVATKEFGPDANHQEDELGNIIALLSNKQAGKVTNKQLNGGGGSAAGAAMMNAGQEESMNMSGGGKNGNNSTSTGGNNGNSKNAGQPQNQSQNPQQSQQKKHNKHHSHVWKLSIPANALFSGELVFRPSTPRKFSFRLPLYLMGVFDDKQLFRDVTALGTGSILSFSHFCVDFGDRVVSRDALSRVPYFLETTITNTSSTGTTILIQEGKEVIRSFDGQEIPEEIPAKSGGISSNKHATAGGGAVEMNEKQQIFFISITKIDLPPGASQKLRVTFQPQHHANYTKVLNLFLKDQPPLTSINTSTTAEESTRPYLKLLCIGSGVYPCMSFSTQTVSLPTVPLSVTTRSVFTLYNHGYAALEIRHRVSPTIPVPLEITYPDGPNIGIMTEKIRVVIAAKSDTPIAFAGKIEFYDMDGERFFVLVQGCMDNSLLSNNSFVQSSLYSNDYGFIGLEEQPVQYLPNPQINELRQQEAKRREELRRLRSLERQKAVESKTMGMKTTIGEEEKSRGKKNSGNNSVTSKSSKNTHKLSTDEHGGDISSQHSASAATAVSYLEGVDIEKPLLGSLSLDEMEAKFVMKFFNTNVNLKRPFEYDRFPYCILDVAGENVIDCLETMSGKKINLRQPNNSLYGSGGGDGNSNKRRSSDQAGDTSSNTANTTNTMHNQKRSSEKSKLIATVDKLVFKYQSILNFLMALGGLLSHINPVTLLTQEDYLLISEYELITKTGDSGGAHFTPAMIQARKSAWQEGWYAQCCHNWLDVMYQSIKLFMLSRITFKEFSVLPGVVLTNRNDVSFGNNSNNTGGNSNAVMKGNKKTGNEKTPKEVIPKDLQNSNVFTHGELVLLAWLSYHLEHVENCVDEGAQAAAMHQGSGHGNNSNTNSSGADPGGTLSTSKRVVDLRQVFSDFYPFVQVFHSHVNDSTLRGEPLAGYTGIDRSSGARKDEIFSRLEEALTQYHVSFVDSISAEEILSSNRNILLFAVHLYFLLPHLIPKTKIEFSGMLGLPIMKKIELKNSSSKKPLAYTVSLKGHCTDFVLDGNEITVNSDSVNEFLITLNAKFKHTVKAKVYFWNIRDPAYAPGATLCFSLQSVIQGINPIERIYKTMSLFEFEHFVLSIRNPYPRDVGLHMTMEILFASQSVDEYMKLHYHLVSGSNANSLASKKMMKKLLKNTDHYINIPLTKPPPTDDEHEHDGQEYLSHSHGHGNHHGNGTGINYITDDWELENLFYQPFWSGEESLSIPKNGSKLLTVHCLPFQLGKYVCSIVFSDPELGEFGYEIHVEVGLPKPTDKLHVDVLQGLSTSMMISLNAKNPTFEKAFNIVSENRVKNANKKIKIRSIFQQLMSTLVKSEDTGAGQFVLDCTTNFFTYAKKVALVSEYLKWPMRNTGNSNGNTGNGPSSTFTAPSNVKLRKNNKTLIEILNPTGTTDGTVTTSSLSDTLNKVLFAFTPEKAGAYKTLAVLYAEDNPHDVRCIEISTMAKVPDAKMSIEFHGPARKVLQQQIPITNETDGDWHLNVTSNHRLFSVPKNIMIPAHQQVFLEISFCSLVAGNFEGKLYLKNVENNDMFEYLLLGEVEEALAEDHMQFSCAARKKTVFHIPLPDLTFLTAPAPTIMDPKNKNRIQEETLPEDPNALIVRKFKVETDLPYAHCAESVDVLVDNPKYDFSVNCPMGGKLTGYISLQDVLTKSVIWYVVNVDVTSPAEEKTILVNTTVRQASMIEITLDNPTTGELVLDVILVGEGLIGEQTFRLLGGVGTPKGAGGGHKGGATSGTTATNTATNSGTNTAAASVVPYELIYSPLIAGNFIGKISFFHESVGEIWYKLQLNALPAPAIEVDCIEAMLGAEGFLTAPIENPLNEQLLFTSSIEDTEHFSISPTKIFLSPFEQAQFRISFRPSSLGEMLHSHITLRNTKLGEIVYHVKGIGTMPGVLPMVTIEGPLQEIVSESIVFRNPFHHPLPLEVFLVNIPTAGGGGYSSPSRHNNNANNTQKPSQQDVDVFSLLLRKSSDLVITPKTPFHIPIGFAPKQLGIYQTSLQIRSTVNGHHLLWCYPIQGIAEVGETIRLPNLKIATKQSLQKDCVIPLVGLSREDITRFLTYHKNDSFSLSSFTISTKIADEHLTNLVQRSFRVQLLELIESSPNPTNNMMMDSTSKTVPEEEEDMLLTDKPTHDFALRCRLLFEPLRMFTTTVDISIICKNHGKWKAKIDLDGTEPEPDDTIKLMASVGETDRISFKLHNRFLGYSNFQAFFKANSSPHFSVFPMTGTLPPFDSVEGTSFVVTFEPKEYGYKELATLNIVTEDAQWTYVLKGSYKESAIQHSMVRSKLYSSKAK